MKRMIVAKKVEYALPCTIEDVEVSHRRWDTNYEEVGMYRDVAKHLGISVAEAHKLDIEPDVMGSDDEYVYVDLIVS